MDLTEKWTMKKKNKYTMLTARGEEKEKERNTSEANDIHALCTRAHSARGVLLDPLTPYGSVD